MNIFDTISKNPGMSNFDEDSSIVGVGLSHALGQTDRQTDITKLIVALWNFAKAPQNYHIPLFLTWVKSAFMMRIKGGVW